MNTSMHRRSNSIMYALLLIELIGRPLFADDKGPAVAEVTVTQSALSPLHGPLKALAQTHFEQLLQTASNEQLAPPASEEELAAKHDWLLQQIISTPTTPQTIEQFEAQERRLLLIWAVLAPAVYALLTRPDNAGAYFPHSHEAEYASKHAKQLAKLESLLGSSTSDEFTNEITLAQLSELVECLRQDLEERVHFLPETGREAIITLLSDRRRVLEAHLIALQQSILKLRPEDHTSTIMAVILISGGILTLGTIIILAAYGSDGWYRPGWMRFKDNVTSIVDKIRS